MNTLFKFHVSKRCVMLFKTIAIILMSISILTSCGSGTKNKNNSKVKQENVGKKSTQSKPSFYTCTFNHEQDVRNYLGNHRFVSNNNIGIEFNTYSAYDGGIYANGKRISGNIDVVYIDSDYAVVEAQQGNSGIIRIKVYPTEGYIVNDGTKYYIK